MKISPLYLCIVLSAAVVTLGLAEGLVYTVSKKSPDRPLFYALQLTMYYYYFLMNNIVGRYSTCMRCDCTVDKVTL